MDEKKREIEARFKELRPLVDEFHRLEAAVAALAGVGRRTRSGPRPHAGGRRQAATLAAPPRARGGAVARAAAGPAASRRSSSCARPGMTIPELAEQMGIQQNYLYRVLPGLQKDGLVRKEGRGWHAMEAA